MSIAVQPTIANRVRAFVERRPEATPDEIASALGVRAVLVRNALGRKQARRVKTVAR